MHTKSLGWRIAHFGQNTKCFLDLCAERGFPLQFLAWSFPLLFLAGVWSVPRSNLSFPQQKPLSIFISLCSCRSSCSLQEFFSHFCEAEQPESATVTPGKVPNNINPAHQYFNFLINSFLDPICLFHICTTFLLHGFSTSPPPPPPLTFPFVKATARNSELLKKSNKMLLRSITSSRIKSSLGNNLILKPGSATFPAKHKILGEKTQPQPG